MKSPTIWIADSTVLSQEARVTTIFLSKLYLVGRRRGNLKVDVSMIIDLEFRSTFTNFDAARSHAEQERASGSAFSICDIPCVAVQSSNGDQLVIVEHRERVDGFAACNPQLQSQWRLGQFAKIIMSQSSVQVLATKDQLQPASMPVVGHESIASKPLDWYPVESFDDADGAINLVCRLNLWLAKAPIHLDDE